MMSKTIFKSRARRAAVLTCSVLIISAMPSLSFAAGGYQNHKAEPQKGDVYAGHMMPKGNMQSRVSEVASFRDNAWITLEGSIISQQDEHHFTFRDNTGEIPLEISDEAWRGLEVDALSLVRVSGYVKHSGGLSSLAIRHIELP